jgi:hypothetical protein
MFVISEVRLGGPRFREDSTHPRGLTRPTDRADCPRTADPDVAIRHGTADPTWRSPDLVKGENLWEPPRGGRRTACLWPAGPAVRARWEPYEVSLGPVGSKVSGKSRVGEVRQVVTGDRPGSVTGCLGAAPPPDPRVAGCSRTPPSPSSPAGAIASTAQRYVVRRPDPDRMGEAPSGVTTCRTAEVSGLRTLRGSASPVLLLSPR